MQVAFEVDDGSTNRSGSFLLGNHRFAFDDVFESDLTSDFTKNRSRERIPATERRSFFDFRTLFDQQHCTGRNGVRLKVTTAMVEDCNFSVSIQYNALAFVVNDVTHTHVLDRTGLLTFLFVLFGRRHRNTTDVERTHRQLCTRFTDTLSSDDTDGHAFFDHVTCGHVHSVTTAANTQRSVTSHRAANLNFLKSQIFDLASDLRRDHL